MSAPTLSSQIYDRNAYPLEELTTSARASLLHRCQQDLADRGATVLPNFVKHDTLTTIISEVTHYLADAFYKPKVHNVYLVEPDTQFTKDHPRNREVSTNSATLGYHGIAQDSALDRLYKDSSFRQFIADALGFETLYPYRDPLSPVNVLVYKPGTTTGWHFDARNSPLPYCLELPSPVDGTTTHLSSAASRIRGTKLSNASWTGLKMVLKSCNKARAIWCSFAAQ